MKRKIRLNQNKQEQMPFFCKVKALYDKAPKLKILMYSVTIVCIVLQPSTVFAASPLGSIDKLSSFIFSAIKAIGWIILGFGIVQVELSLKSHDASQGANGFLTLFGGLVIAFAKEILDLIK